MRATVLATSGARYSEGICQFGGLDVTRSTVLRMSCVSQPARAFDPHSTVSGLSVRSRIGTLGTRSMQVSS